MIVGVGIVLCPESVSVAPLTTARPLRTMHRTAVAAPATAGSWDPVPQGGIKEAETAREGTPWQRYAMLSRPEGWPGGRLRLPAPGGGSAPGRHSSPLPHPVLLSPLEAYQMSSADAGTGGISEGLPLTIRQL